jgi:phage tail tape-measure protein
MKSARMTAAAISLLFVSFELHAQAPNQNTGAAGGAVAGAVTGAIVGGPIGAVIGGVIGATAGAALAPPDAVQVQQYVVRQNVPSVRSQQQVVVGQPLPQAVPVYALPPESGVATPYRYSVVNQQTVLVDPRTGQVVQVLQ